MSSPPPYRRPDERDTEEQQMEAEIHARKLKADEDRRKTINKAANIFFTVLLCVVAAIVFFAVFLIL